MFDERTARILEAAIESFIDTGEPVSSGLLYERYDFGIKPAMIRLELEDLSDKGFLEQPHHSAGRVPSDKGYEFFAERVLDNRSHSREHHNPIQNLLARRAWPNFLEEMSEELGLLSVASAEENIYKTGIENLMDNLEWETPEEVRSVINDFVEIDERINKLRKQLCERGGPRVFVGKKSPVTRSENLSVVMGSCEADGGQVLLFAVGPKRMDYKKTLRIFKNL